MESDGLCKTEHRYRLTFAFTLCICINPYYVGNKKQGRGSLDPVVQSIICLTSSLVIKMLTILIRRISNSQVFLLKNMRVAFANAKATHILQQKIGVVGWCEGAVYLTSLGRPSDIGLQLGKARYPCSG